MTETAGEHWRLFVALPIPLAVLEQLEILLEPLRAAWPQVRFLPPSGLHVTLVFLGETPRAAVLELRAVVARAAARVAPFTCRIAGAGSFGGRGRPRVAWLGFDNASRAALGALAGALADGLRRSSDPHLSAAAPLGPFRPHLTICRHATPALPAALGARLEEVPPISWRADRIALYRSHLEQDGAEHVVLASQRLGWPQRP